MTGIPQKWAKRAQVPLNEEQADFFRELSTHYIQSRYPEEIEDISSQVSVQQAQQVVKRTEEVVRWGLQDYLLPVFRQSFTRVPGHDLRYEYRYPPQILDKTAREWFWRLMNHVRSQPYIKRFVGAHYLKGTSSLEQP